MIQITPQGRNKHIGLRCLNKEQTYGAVQNQMCQIYGVKSILHKPEQI